MFWVAWHAAILISVVKKTVQTEDQLFRWQWNGWRSSTAGVGAWITHDLDDWSRFLLRKLISHRIHSWLDWKEWENEYSTDQYDDFKVKGYPDTLNRENRCSTHPISKHRSGFMDLIWSASSSNTSRRRKLSSVTTTKTKDRKVGSRRQRICFYRILRIKWESWVTCGFVNVLL